MRPAALLDLDADRAHHRTVISLAGFASSLEDGLVALVAEAAGRIDLRRHRGVHPRVGAADVVPVVPLDASLDEAAGLADRLGRRIHRELQLPVYFYGAALGGPTLADIRAGRAAPALGSAGGGPAGAVCVGARPPLVAYNVVLPGASSEAAAALARGLRAARTGGLPGVQALAFPIGAGMQLSMNLVDLEAAPPAAVLAEVRRRCSSLGIEAGADEVVGLCPAAVAPPAAAGRILEGRLAAAAARRTALACRTFDPRLAGELEVAASELAGAEPADTGLLVAAERALQVWRAAAGIPAADAEARAMLSFAIAGLRSALPPDLRTAHAARIRRLEEDAPSPGE